MIHPSAIVESGAELGTDVQIGPFAYVAATARLGDGCVLNPHAVVLKHTTLGARCKVHSAAVIGDDPQDLSYTGDVSFVVTGEDCTFREGVTIHRGAGAGSTTRIGNHVYMMANTHAAHNTEVGDHVIMATGAALGGHVTVATQSFIGGNTGVHQFCHIGRLAMLGAGTILTKDLPPFCLSPSSNASKVSGLNSVGLRRSGLDSAERKLIQQAFRILYRSGLNRTQAQERLRTETDNPFALEIADFLDGAKRGICPPAFDVSFTQADA